MGAPPARERVRDVRLRDGLPRAPGRLRAGPRAAARERTAADARGPRDLRRVLRLRAGPLGAPAAPADRAHRARDDGAIERSLGEIDYLLGVRDDLRQGALRFRDPATGTYLADEQVGVPKLLELPRAARARRSAWNARRRREARSRDAPARRQLARRRTPEGARGRRERPHRDRQAPEPADRRLGRHPLGGRGAARWRAKPGITVPDAGAHVFGGKAILVVDRFDREDGRRIGYVSAMTMLEATDGDAGSYLDIADAIERHAPNAGDRPAGAVAADRVHGPDLQHRRPPAQPRLPAHEQRRLVAVTRVRPQPRPGVWAHSSSALRSATTATPPASIS